MISFLNRKTPAGRRPIVGGKTSSSHELNKQKELLFRSTIMSRHSSTNLRRTWKSMENLNKAVMEIQENSNSRQTCRRYSNLYSSSRRRSASESSEDYTNDHTAQKEDLEFVATAVEKLNSAFAKIDRYGHGIPSIRPVRELCGKLKIQLNNEHGAFNRTLEHLVDGEVPGHRAIVKCVEEIRKAVNDISSNESEYIPRMEDIKQQIGALSGIVATVLELEYNNL